MAEERASRDDVAVRVVVLFVPIVLTARLLSFLVPKPLAWAASMLAWLLVIYWLPTRTELNLWRWVFIVSASAITAFLIATFQPDLF